MHECTLILKIHSLSSVHDQQRMNYMKNQMNSVSLTMNSLRQQFGAFVAFHFAQNRVFHVATVLSISLLHLGRVGTLLGLHLAAWHNLGRWEALDKLSHCIGRLFSFSGCPAPRWRCCDAISVCEYIIACPFHDWTHHMAHYSHQIHDRALPSRSACMHAIMNAKIAFLGGDAPPTSTATCCL